MMPQEAPAGMNDLAQALAMEGPMDSTQSEPQRSFLLEEYHALRDEIVQRVQARQQMWSVLLVIAGSFLSIGVQPGIAAWTILLYPIIALFFSVNWAHNDTRIDQLTWYIQHQIEPAFQVVGWETYRSTHFRRTRRGQASAQNPLALLPGLNAISARGIFVSTQILAASVGVTRLAQTAPIVLVVLVALVEVVATATTFRILADRKVQAVKKAGGNGNVGSEQQPTVERGV
jgi:hypothetical protein